MKIQEVTIEGYQSHTNSTFRLSPGLTVITGPSDAGKTAIIRALRWFAFNEPTGEAFLHTIRNPDGSVKEAVDQVKVSVTFDNGITITKTRRKGKTTYTHSAFPTAWEKAEIPPEIKETLGLVKQQYGDFETCLNFAFQLDAPFMLSESASIGAKVLGKLAGTEIVDKSISEVNKKTHQTRNDISYADKQIGEIDVSLTEYFDLDRFDAELKIAEAAFTKLKEDQSRHVALTALMSSYQLNTEQRIKYYDEVERLAGVVVASVSLGIAEREQAKKEKLEDLNTGFWKAVQDQNEPLRVIHITRNLEDFFCGCGGLGLGFQNAGFKIVGAWDFDKYAVATYRENVGDHVVQADIQKMCIEDVPKADVWAFGFPCQDLSVAGKQAGIKLECADCGTVWEVSAETYSEENLCPGCGGTNHRAATRSGMFFEIMRLLAEAREREPEKVPKVLVAENVKALRKLLPVLEAEYGKAGYKCHAQLFNSKYWGVPQNRERYIVVGTLDSLPDTYTYPEEQHD